MLELFANPAYLVAGGALISSPIIIHLINRMRFKRLRWAAMEFLLKAQKRSRRRLIIEQLILLLLRCLLVALAALLVARFMGFSLNDLGALFGAQQENVHVVVLDDTLSMRDQWKDGDGEKDCFTLARKDVLVEGILKKVAQSTTNDKVIILPLSKVATDPKFQPKVYDHLNTAGPLADAIKDALALQPSMLHVDPAAAVTKAFQVATGDLGKAVDKALGVLPDPAKLLKDRRVTVHVVSDFRQRDWVGLEARPLQDALLKLARNGMKVRLVDTAHPLRVRGQGNAPPFHDNIGIVDMRANTRVTGKGMPIQFAVTVANFTPRDTEVHITLFEHSHGVGQDAEGREMLEVTFNERLPLKVPAGQTATATFEHKFFPDLKENETFFGHISARLESPQRGPLENDGLLEDNVRHVAVEIRNKVPVLVVDGRDADGRKEGGDSYFVEHALGSVLGSSYEVVHAYKLERAAGDARKALEAPDLSQYPTILLLNVPSLTPEQTANLEKYVHQGGGVGFFLGPNVDAVQYNEQLYKKGLGVFPVPLEEKFFPPAGKPDLPTEYDEKRPKLLLRDDQFAAKGAQIPIFGAIFKEEKLRGFLKHLPVRRYWPTLPQSEWQTEFNRAREVVNLPNEKPVLNSEYAAEAVNIANSLPLDRDEYKPYHANLRRHREAILAAAQSPKTMTHQLAETLKDLLTDRGDNRDLANLTIFWKLSDPKLDTLAKDVQALRRRLLYSHPMMVVGQVGQGRVVAVLTSAGRAWNDWAGGITGSVLFAPFIWEMQNYLSSHSGESSLTVGTRMRLTVDPKRYENKPLKVSRYYYKAQQGKAVQLVPMEIDQFQDAVEQAAPVVVLGPDGKPVLQPQPEKKEPAPAGAITFTLPRSPEPGLYVTFLQFANQGKEATPLAVYGNVFNVDTAKEGRLQRASQEDLNSGFLSEAPPDMIDPLINPTDPEQPAFAISTRNDVSEWPWFFLLFLGILVAEQALAVHLSFHLKGTEAELPSQVVHPHGKAA